MSRAVRLRRSPALAAAVLSASLLFGPAGVRADPGSARFFPDRPVAWAEHDDGDVPTPPAGNHLQDLDSALLIRDSIANEVDRVLALDGSRPAADVNALDEVPCSTWYCARNHLAPMDTAALVAGPPAAPPVPPLRIVKGKDTGAAPGFQVVDARGKKFMLKLDADGHFGLSTGAELVGARLFYAAGYDTPGSFLLALGPTDLVLDPHATYVLYDVEKRPLSREHVDAVLAHVARNADGSIRAVAVPWLPGRVLGAFDMIGRQGDDPNDRIPHEDRRSLRADWLMYAWLSIFDASAINTLESYVEEDGRHFVRHYHFDFGCAFGSATKHPQALHQDGEHTIEVGRTLAAFFSLGLYRRPFQTEREAWAELTRKYPSIGYYPAEGFVPEAYRSNRKIPAHMRLTARDLYWGAKVVTSFSNAQLEAVVAVARLPAADAAYLVHALEVRRDIIGRRYLAAFAAVEAPAASDDGARVCFEDLALARGYALAAGTRYAFEVTDGHGTRLAAGEAGAAGTNACVPTGGVGRGTGYRVVSIAARYGPAAGPTRASRIHLRWREAERRFVVVGLERDE
jgi:hypothetical protein